MSTREGQTKLDFWREPEALANEGCAGTLEVADAAIEDAIEMLTYHDRKDAASELRQVRGRVREERDRFLDRAGQARASYLER